MKKIITLLLGVCLSWFGCKKVTAPESEPQDQQTALDKIRLITDRLEYTVADTIFVTLINDSQKSVFLEGCNQFYLASKVDTGWVDAPIILCFWEGYGVKVAPASRHRDRHEAEYFVGTHKFSAPLYFGCKEGEPISSAECTGRSVIRSAEFTVRD